MKKLRVILFFPLSLAWGFVYRMRRQLYTIGFFKSYRLHHPVISVGNISFGGTGKTPHVIYLDHLLGKLRKRGLVLTRGYKSKKMKENTLLNKNESNSLFYGDEPCLLSQNLKHSFVAVGANRLESYQKFSDQVGCDIVFLDDGFQHLKVKRDLNILLIDSCVDPGDYFCAPSGQLREHFKQALYADIFILTKINLATKDQVDYWRKRLNALSLEQTPLFYSKLKNLGLFELGNQQRVDSLPKKAVIACGLGNPLSFERTVLDMGIEKYADLFKPDHYQWKQKDFELKIPHYIPIILSEKDAMKCQGFNLGRRKIYYTKIEVQLENEASFLSFIQKVVS